MDKLFIHLNSYYYDRLKISNLDLTNSEDYQLVHFGNESNMLYAVYAKVEVDCNNSSMIKQIDFLIRAYPSSGNDDVVFHNPEIRIDQSTQVQNTIW